MATTILTFSAQVDAWIRKVKDAEKLVFHQSVDELQRRLTQTVTEMVYDQPPAKSGYVRTGFLRASLVASKEAMPTLTRENPGGAFSVDENQIEAVIEGSELGDTIYLGYTAKYGAYVAYGAKGQSPRPWVDLVAQTWPQIVAEQCARVKQELGL